jgi:RNA polymerase sigma-70 factor, ECF subfamily
MLTDDELFAEIVRRKAEGLDFRRELGELVERWKAASIIVVRRVQGSYLRGSPDDGLEIFQDAFGKFLTRGIDQFRGVSERMPGKSASPRTFFLRIVKHCAIDRYRRNREDLDSGPPDGEEEREESTHQVARAVAHAAAKEDANDARTDYWAAFRRLQEEHPNEAGAWDLYHHQDMDDHTEVARILGITVVNSYKRVSRAQAYLKLYLLEARREEE